MHKQATAYWFGLTLPIMLGTLVTRLDGDRPSRPQVDSQLAGLAVPFLANEGQSDPRVAYYAPTFAGTVFVTRQGEIVHALPGHPRADRRQRSEGWALTESFVGGHAAPVAAQPSATKVSLFLGNDPERWRAHAATAAAVSLGEVYPGIRVQLNAYGKQVERVFTVQPGAAASAIQVRVAGAQGMEVTPDGALAVRTGLGEVRLTRPVAYQEVDGERHAVGVAYAVAGDTYGFRVASYDAGRPVVIDPLLQATYLGGSNGEEVRGLALNAATGEVYVAGLTSSTDFPGTSGGAQSANAGGRLDAFVARLNPSLTTLDQATYLGGSGDDTAFDLALNATTGEVYVAGFTDSTDFPSTSGGAQSANAGGRTDAFIARLSPSLTTLDQATYLGGSGQDDALALALNATTGEVYVAGNTSSTDLPGTSGGAQSALGGSADGFVARLSANLTSLDQATYLGGSEAVALALNAATGEVYVAGGTSSPSFPGTSGGAQSASGGSSDAIVARLNPSLTTLDQATYLGGSGGDNAWELALNATTGEVYVGGTTDSTDFPGTGGGAQTASGGSYDVFVARLNATLTTLDQATYLGGSGRDITLGLALNATTGEVYVAGDTSSTNFPGTGGGAQSAFGGGGADGFVARLNPSLTTLDQATYLGGSAGDDPIVLALNATTGEVYVVGGTGSTDFPGTSGGAQSAHGGSGDVFIARLSADLAAGTAAPTQTPIPIPTNTPAPPTPSNDLDGDGAPNNIDNCPSDFNPAQSDGNHNGIGDMCDSGTPEPLTLSRVHLKAAPNGTISIRAKLDATEWGSLPDALAHGLTVGVIGAGLPAPEVLSFPGIHCFALSASRMTCLGTRGETARFRKMRKANVFNITIRAKDRMFSPPLTASGVQVVLSTGGLDRRDAIPSCKAPRRGKSATCKK